MANVGSAFEHRAPSRHDRACSVFDALGDGRIVAAVTIIREAGQIDGVSDHVNLRFAILPVTLPPERHKQRTSFAGRFDSVGYVDIRCINRCRHRRRHDKWRNEGLEQTRHIDSDDCHANNMARVARGDFVELIFHEVQAANEECGG